MMPLWPVAAALWSGLAVGVPGPSVPPWTLAQYSTSIHQARVRVDHVVPSAGNSPALVAAARQLRLLQTVRLPDGGIIHTSTAQLADQLASRRAADIQTARSALDTLDNTLQRSTATHVSPASLHELDTVLQDSRFHPPRTFINDFEDWLGAQVDNILNAIGQFLIQFLPGSPSAPPAIQLIAAIVFLVALAILGVLLARSTSRHLVREPRATDEREEPVTSTAADDREARYAADGDYRTALRYLVLALLLRLQERGLLELRPGLTNREYLRTLPATLHFADDARIALEHLVDAFDRTWYGHQAIDRAEFDRCRELARAVTQSAGGEQAA